MSFVETSDEAFTLLLQQIDKLRSATSGTSTTAAYDDAAPYLAKHQYGEVLRQVCALHSVLFTESEKEAEESMYVVCYLLHKAVKGATVDAATKLIESFAASLTSTSDPYPVLRLKILSTVFNLIGEKHPARAVVFTAIIKYSAATNTPDLIIPLLDRVDGWLSEWGTDADGRRNVLLTVSQSLAKCRGRQALAHNFLLKYLEQFDGANDATLAKAEPQALEAVVQAISVTNIYQFERYLQLAAVQHLKKGSHAKVVDLLVIFGSKSLADFLDFEKANGAVLKTLVLDREACVHKMRLLSLCSLASSSASVSFAEVASCMHIEEKEVERWVIRAISAKLIDARIDQPSRRVIINSSTERMFSTAQWSQLEAKLATWRDGINSLVQVVRKVREENAE